jgi:AraC-like DNA-binding protein
VIDRAAVDIANIGQCATPERFDRFDDFALRCCNHPHPKLLSDPESFSVTRRSRHIGGLTLSEIMVHGEMSINFGQCATTYSMHMLQSGHAKFFHRGRTTSAGAGSAYVYTPETTSAAQWAAGTRIIGLKLDRHTVDEARTEVLGGAVTSQADFTPIMATTEEPTHSWSTVLLHFKAHLFRPDSILNQPLVGMPFVDSLVRGFLLAADPRYREAANSSRSGAPHQIRQAVDIIEAQPHLPLTVSTLAASCNVSVRTLQETFRRHLNMSPTEYLREVRLRRAHQMLLRSDPSMVSVASVAYHWGFSHPGRFSAAHTARYGESPAVTLHRD